MVAVISLGWCQKWHMHIIYTADWLLRKLYLYLNNCFKIVWLICIVNNSSEKMQEFKRAIHFNCSHWWIVVNSYFSLPVSDWWFDVFAIRGLPIGMQTTFIGCTVIVEDYLVIVFHEQSNLQLQLGRSLAWDHFQGDITDRSSNHRVIPKTL